MNILVCDDEKEIVDAIEIYLKNEGYQIYKAYDGQQALEVLEQHPIQLIIMDVMMPRLDGIRATLKIRENTEHPGDHAVGQKRRHRQDHGPEHRRR